MATLVEGGDRQEPHAPNRSTAKRRTPNNGAVAMPWLSLADSQPRTDIECDRLRNPAGHSRLGPERDEPTTSRTVLDGE